MYKTLVSAGILVLASCHPALAEPLVQDHFKNVISKPPYNIEVGTNQQVSGDKTGDALTGAIIGGIIGNNIKGEKDGGAIEALLGGMLGHSNSDAVGGTKRVCNVETRYNEVAQRVYSHSTVIFNYQGKQYTLRFNK